MWVEGADNNLMNDWSQGRSPEISEKNKTGLVLSILFKIANFNTDF